ncbi:MAG: hypothetical protein OXG78_11305 [Chloroflexi bacterium]|nr:hypothetical protein [Chloroflexota bacterium]
MCRARATIEPRRLARQLVLSFLALACLISQAQDTGQICLQAYADQNEDGLRTEAEAPIARGIAASLLDERGITIGAQLLEDSPYAADGLLCFDQLLAGRYRIIISSSEYSATTATTAEAAVSPGAAPARIDFGAKPLTVAVAPAILTGLAALDADAVPTLLVAVGAAVIAIIGLSLLGCLLVALILRGRNRAKTRQPAGPATRNLQPAPPPEDEALSPRLTKDPSEGSPPLFTDEDQQW